MNKHCPHCGLPMPSASRPAFHLSPIKQRIFEAVRSRPGLDSNALRDVVWADDPNGGPEDPKNLHVQICQMNRRLAASGLRIRGSRTDGYRLIEIGGTK